VPGVGDSREQSCERSAGDDHPIAKAVEGKDEDRQTCMIVGWRGRRQTAEGQESGGEGEDRRRQNREPPSCTARWVAASDRRGDQGRHPGHGWRGRPDGGMAPALERRPSGIALQRPNLEIALGKGPDRLGGGKRPGGGGVIGYLHHQRRAAQGEAILHGLLALGRIEDELDIAVLHGVDNIGPALQHFFDPLDRQALRRQIVGGAARRDDAAGGPRRRADSSRRLWRRPRYAARRALPNLSP